MKIISNFKDYYDFLIGKYVIDDKCIYNRICSTEDKASNKWFKSGIYNPDFNKNKDYQSFTIHFCGTAYYGHFYNGKIYYGLEAADNIPSRIKSYVSWYNSFDRDRGKCSAPTPTDVNNKLDCPVVVYISHIDTIKNPKLSDFSFAQVVHPEDAFIKISNFIGREKDFVNTQTDKDKIISHGFDYKVSFRHRV